MPSPSSVVRADAAMEEEKADARRVRAVWESLTPVTDPELDESVVELGFVTSVTVTGGTVGVRFHLPTYWCAANFAFLMAFDMRRAVLALAWVETVTVELDEHMYAETINRGMAAGRSFQDTFGDEADDELHRVRETFRRKAYQQRQELLLRYLLANGHERAALVAMPLAALARLSAADEEGARLLGRYREIRAERPFGTAAATRAFVDVDGRALSLERLDAYLAELRGIRINTQFNGEICRGLLQARYGERPPRPHEVRVDFPRPGLRGRPERGRNGR